MRPMREANNAKMLRGMTDSTCTMALVQDVPPVPEPNYW